MIERRRASPRDSSISVRPAIVRGHELRRQEIVSPPDDDVYVGAFPLGRPRLWERARQHVIDGFLGNLRVAETEGEARLLGALDAARDSLVEACEAMVERDSMDCALMALMFEGQSLHVVSAGPSRIYLKRADKVLRLTPKVDEPVGLLQAEPFKSTTLVESGDRVLAGSISAFSERSIDEVKRALESNPDVRTSVLADLLTEPAAKAGLGASALALHIV